MTTFQPSPYQQAIFDFVSSNPSDSLIIHGVAGCGKTTTIVELSKFLQKDRRCIFLAFNKNIADTLALRLPYWIKASTFHSLCWQTYRQAHPGASQNKDKCRDILNSLVPNFHQRQKIEEDVQKLVRYAKSAGHGFLPNAPSLHELIDTFSMFIKDEYEVTQIAEEILEQSAVDRLVLDFDDMLLFCLDSKLFFQPCHRIVVDEVQDTNEVQRVLIRKMLHPGGSVVGVGDSSQCQPAGTLVLTNRGSVPIEQVTQDDKVLTYHKDVKHIRERAVCNTASRHFEGELIKVETVGGQSYEATPNHKCVTRIKNVVRDWCGIYLMQKGMFFRVGKTQLFYGKGQFGLAMRARQEKADAAWLLTAKATKEDALMTEQLVAAQFGIPDMCFMNSGETAIDQQRIDRFWGTIGDNFNRGEQCLIRFGRGLAHPIWTKGDDENQVSTSRQFLTPACNLDPSLFELPVIIGDDIQWRSFSSSRRVFSGDVYSLAIETNPSTNNKGTYIANGILTGNSIYQFRGADSEAMDLFQKEFNCHELPLSVSYRCSKSVVDAAKEYSSEILSHPDAPEGFVESKEDYSTSDFGPSSVVLCRLNAPLVGFALGAIRRSLKCQILGRDIGASLIKLIKSFKTDTIKDTLDALEQWRKKEVSEAESQGKRYKIDNIEDRAASIRMFCMNRMQPTSSISLVLDQIKMMFSDDKSDKLTLSTVHKAKGLEWDNVFLLDKEALMPSKYAATPSAIQQENNLIYVAITRAKQNLYYIQSNGWK